MPRSRPRPRHAGALTPGYTDPEGTQYTINVNMPAATVNALVQGQYRLHLFKAVSSPTGGGAPTVWAATSKYSVNTTMRWTEEYYAYASMRTLQKGVNFSGSDTSQINLGQVLEVDDNAVVSVSDKGGTPGQITITNTTHQQFSCGLAQPNSIGSGQPAPVCAFPLYGGNHNMITPLEKVALVFAAGPYTEGTVVESSIGPAVLVDLTQANPATLGYDINEGWSWQGNVAADVPSDQFVRSLVVTPSFTDPDGKEVGIADPVTGIGIGIGIGIWTVSVDGQRPINLLARGSSGYTDQDSLACRLQSIGHDSPLVRQGSTYIATYRDQSSNEEMWRVRCVYEGDYADTPFDFRNLEQLQ